MRNRIEMRFLALALAAAMTVAALSGCGKGGQSGKENTQAQTEQEAAPEETPAAEEPAPAEPAPAEPSAEETTAAGETPAAQEPEKPEPSTPAEPEQPAAPAQETPASPSAEQDPGQKLWPDGKFALNGVAYQLFGIGVFGCIMIIGHFRCIWCVKIIFHLSSFVLLYIIMEFKSRKSP